MLAVEVFCLLGDAMETMTFFWVIFGVVVGACIALDLFVFHRHAHEVRFREALGWASTWILLAILFNGGIYLWLGKRQATEFFAVYLIELSLSIDNLFVFLLIFTYFRVPAAYQHRVLFWGVIGALGMRAIFIATGLALLNLFHWVIYVFGGILIITALRLVIKPSEEIAIERNLVLRIAQRLMPITYEYHGQRFFVRKGRQIVATPLFIVLLIVETTDLMFAVDSVPAALAISRDPFVVYTANVLAILGLRSFFFVLSRLLRILTYLHYGLAVILAFIGVKMIISPFYKIHNDISLNFVVSVLLTTLLTSLLIPFKKQSSDSD
jgi:tellurite resistance protein TerC